MRKKNTATRPAKPTREQRQTANTLRELYAGKLDARPGTRQKISLYLHRLLDDTGTPRKGKPKYELYLEAVTKPGLKSEQLLYDEWVTRHAAEAVKEHANSPGEQIRKSLALAYTGTPNPKQSAVIDALLEMARFHLTLCPASLDLAQAIYAAACEAWAASRRQYKDDHLPDGLEYAAGALHVGVLIATGDARREEHAAFIKRGRERLAAWYGETEAPAEGRPVEATFEQPKNAEVVDLLCWIQSHPRPITTTLFAEKE